MHYLVVIEAGGDPVQVNAVVPDLPGCFAAGASIEEALAATQHAIAAWITEALDIGRSIPPATPLAALRRRHRAWRHRTWMAVEVDPAILDDTQDRVSIRLPRRLLRRLDAQARSAGETRSGYIARLALEGAPVR